VSELTRDLFAPHLGSVFRVQAGAATVDLTLAFVSELRSSPRAQAFSIEFRGPVTAALPQGEYRFEHPKIGAFQLFIVPVGRVDDELEYEAVFNRVLPMS
jgi:hypothetical protein